MISSLDFAVFAAALLALVALVFFWGGRQWERAGDLAPVAPPPAPDRETTEMLGWVHQMGGEPARAPAPPLVPLPPPPPRVPLPGPVRAYSALAAWRLEQETATPADTSVTKLTASIVRGMDYREQIDRYGADILAQLRRNLHGERAA